MVDRYTINLPMPFPRYENYDKKNPCQSTVSQNRVSLNSSCITCEALTPDIISPVSAKNSRRRKRADYDWRDLASSAMDAQEHQVPCWERSHEVHRRPLGCFWQNFMNTDCSDSRGRQPCENQSHLFYIMLWHCGKLTIKSDWTKKLMS